MPSSAAFVAAVAAVVALLSTTAAAGWWTPASLASAAPAVQRQRYALLADATKLSYQATHGSYYNESFANATILGFVRDFSLEANPAAGMRALVFVDGAAARVLIAFRGTDMDILARSGQADVCADAMLWGHHPYETLGSLYPFCLEFPRSTLDYAAAAQRVARRVAAAYPRADLMYTGHSLGAGLGMLMVAGRGACTPASAVGAVVFSSPQMVVTALLTLPVDVAALDPDRFLVAADPYDPVFVRATAGRFGGLLGAQCTFPRQVPPPQDCVECERVPANISDNVPGCLQCFTQHHIFSHYLQLLKSDKLPHCAQPINHCVGSACVSHGKCGTD